MKRIIFILIIVLSFAQCAKKGTISGGIKDVIPPKLLKATPIQNSTNFKGKEIRLYFDEYVKLKDLNKNLIISPPQKHKPIISPQGAASKIIKIKIQDTLKANTTYIFNFGQSIVDNNEGNPYPNFKYVFSTGSVIDSLTLKGSVHNALDLKDPKEITVMLYEINAQYNDSIIYKEKPDYLTNTLSDNNFEFTNLKAGKYRLIAIDDSNNNQKYNPKTEALAFLKETITLPDTISKKLILSKAVAPFKALKPKNISKGKILIAFEGDSSAISIEPKTKMDYFVQKIQKKDSLLVWYRQFKTDSVALTIAKGKYKHNYLVKLRRKKQDTVKLQALNRGVLVLNKKVQFGSATPLEKINDSHIHITDKDSVAVAFSSSINMNRDQLLVGFDPKENNEYHIKVMPGAVEDYFGNSNKDTLTNLLKTKKKSDYGSLKISFSNKKYGVFVQLINTKNNKIVKSAYLDQKVETILFEYINPTTYLVRILIDQNNNKKWDAGNFTTQKLAEKVVFFPKPLDVRANWDLEESFEFK